MSSPVTVRVTHRYNVSADKVFDAWLMPAIAARFLFATRTGNIMHCEIEPAVGGQFVVTDRRPVADGDESFFDAQHRGTFLEIDRPKRITFEFVVEPYTEEPTKVTLDFLPMGISVTDLVLTHDLGEGEDAKVNAKRTEQGWEKMLDHLEKVLTTKTWGGFTRPGGV
ncbi:SRPBCC family protein [Ramlibacter sp. PS4R-6]|uniref:SRPBCC family protein n=1 Tax=Ramlibacter sp. PS4R-6 TaxID=3133438 RepID=UPI003099A8E8